MQTEQIRCYLESKGITQSFLARRIDMSVVTLNAILNGKRKLLATEYFDICKALDVPVDLFTTKTG